AWLVDVDEATGGWRLDGVVGDSPGSRGYYFHSEDIKFEGGKLTFKASPVDSDKKKILPGGTAASLKLQDGKLQFDGIDAKKKPVTKTLQKTGDEMVRSGVEVWGMPKVALPDPGSPAETPDLTDANYVWRSLAG